MIDTALVARLVAIAATQIGVHPDRVLSASRDASVTAARHAVMYALRERGWYLADIGLVTNRDHSTVHHGVRRVERQQRIDPELRRLCALLTGEQQPVADSISAALTEVTGTCLALLWTVGRLQHELDNERAIRARESSTTRRVLT